MKRTVIYETERGRSMDLDDLEKILADARTLNMSAYRVRPVVAVRETPVTYGAKGTIRKVTLQDGR